MNEPMSTKVALLPSAPSCRHHQADCDDDHIAGHEETLEPLEHLNSFSNSPPHAGGGSPGGWANRDSLS
jgi:hypothetical protein